MRDAVRPADQIRAQLQRVEHLRNVAQHEPLRAALHEVKRLQAQRFQGTYADFLAEPLYASATRFFLEELYGGNDFSQRDDQFGRIASAIERLFPAAVAQLAVDLAETHALTESLDHDMARHWSAQDQQTAPAERYLNSWRLTGERALRMRQLEVVQHMGAELQHMTRKKSLLFALRLMRQPAHAAGLGALQHFLERGFSSFASMADPSVLMDAIAVRETTWIQRLFDEDATTCQHALTAELAQA